MSIELRRKNDLVEAAIREIGETGTLEVTVSRIARRAGVSSALAFHYFGDKEHLFLAAMRHLLGLFATEVREALTASKDPRQRLEGVIGACFSPANFQPGVRSAWLNFYVLAYRSDEARRLLRVYHRRLNTNLVHDLRPLAGDRAQPIAERLAGLIDGLYLHFVHDPSENAGENATAHVLTALANELEACR